MVRAEWGIPLKTSEDAKFLLNVIRSHNSRDDVGETLRFNSILNFRDKFYAILNNSGDWDKTNTFLENNLTQKMWSGTFKPFTKPDDWFACENFLWNNMTNYPVPQRLPQSVLDEIG